MSLLNPKQTSTIQILVHRQQQQMAEANQDETQTIKGEKTRTNIDLQDLADLVLYNVATKDIRLNKIYFILFLFAIVSFSTNFLILQNIFVLDFSFSESKKIAGPKFLLFFQEGIFIVHALFSDPKSCKKRSCKFSKNFLEFQIIL